MHGLKYITARAGTGTRTHAHAHTMVMVLACVRSLHELGREPVILLLLTSSHNSCKTARYLKEEHCHGGHAACLSLCRCGCTEINCTATSVVVDMQQVTLRLRP